MNRQGLAAILLLALLGMGFFIITNCGGTPLVNTTSTNENKVWQNVGLPGFSLNNVSNVSLFVYNGTPYVAYKETSIESSGFSVDYARVMKYNGSSWESVGDPAYCPKANNFVSLFIFNGIPYLGTGEQSNGDTMGYFKAAVLKFENGSWESIGGDPGFSAGGTGYGDLFVDNGVPFLAYYDVVNSNGCVAKYNGITWESVGSPNFSGSEAQHNFSLYVYNGIPYLAYRHDPSNEVSVIKYNGSSWENVGSPAFSAGAGTYLSLYVYNGTPYVAFAEDHYYPNPASQQELISEATLMKFNGTSWEYVGKPGFSDGQARFVSLSIDNDTPYVAYVDDSLLGFSRASLMKFNGSSWDYVGSRGFSSGGTSNGVSDTSLSIFNGIPYIAFRDLNQAGKITVMKFAPQ